MTKREEKTQKEFIRRIRALTKSDLTANNLTTAIKTFAMPIMRYGFGILKWTKTELVSIDRKVRKILTKTGFHHPKLNTHRLYAERGDGGRGIKSVLDCRNEECSSIASYLAAATEDPLTQLINDMERKRPPTVAIQKYAAPAPDNTDPARTSITHIEEMKKMPMHGQWRKARDQIANIDVKNSELWLTKSNLRPETESLICSAQEQALATNYVRSEIWKQKCNPTCRLCGEKNETVSHVISGCKILAGTKYTTRHDRIGTYIHWSILKDIGVEVSDEWYKHIPKTTVQYKDTTIMWDKEILTDKKVQANRPDITIHDRKKQSAILIDVSVPNDKNIIAKTAEKLMKYRDLEIEIKKCWKLKKVKTIPIIIGALGSVSTGHQKFLTEISPKIEFKVVQKTALLGTANILRHVLSMETKETT